MQAKETQANGMQAKEMQVTTTGSETIQIQVGGGKTFSLELPQFADSECAFILGVRKSGSTLMNIIIQRLCELNNFPSFALADKAFQQNILFKEWTDCDVLNQVVRDGCIYLGFRALPAFLLRSELFKSRKKILLVRDPRDAIVSEYFTVIKNHSLPQASTANSDGERESLLQRREIAQQQGIDEYVLENAKHFRATVNAYIPLLKEANLKVYRYEDIVLNKAPWITDMAAYLGLSLSEDALNMILADVDIVPGKERSTEFVRKVVPGDHREKLMPETIAQLNQAFAEFMSAFSYT